MRRTALALVLVAFALGGAALTGAQTADPTVTPVVPDDVTEGETAAASLNATDTPDDANVGAYRMNLSYDPSVANVTASDTSTFTVRTRRPTAGVLTVVGYTDQSTTAGGDLALASLTVTGESTGDSDLDVTVERFTDTNGTALPYSVSNATFEVTATSTTTTMNTTTTTSANTTTSGGGGGGGGGGGFFPAPEDSTTTTTTGTTTTTTEPTTTTESTTTESTTTTTETTTESTTETTSPTTTESTTETTDSGGTPGFGVPIALLALTAAALLALRRP